MERWATGLLSLEVMLGCDDGVRDEGVVGCTMGWVLGVGKLSVGDYEHGIWDDTLG